MFEILEWAEVEQHHDEQHFRQAQLAGPAALLAAGDQLVFFPILVNLGKINKTAEQGSDIQGHETGPGYCGKYHRESCKT